MTLRKLGRIIGGIGLSLLAATLLFLVLLFTDVLTETEERVMYDCTACLKKDPTRCKTIEQDWWSMVDVKTEEDAREHVAFRLCHEVVPPGEDAVKNICGDWVLDQRDQVFDVRCTSRLERRKKPWMEVPIH
jgi:hypothetical protein